MPRVSARRRGDRRRRRYAALFLFWLRCYGEEREEGRRNDARVRAESAAASFYSARDRRPAVDQDGRLRSFGLKSAHAGE